jgi:hypothetical protein
MGVPITLSVKRNPLSWDAVSVNICSLDMVFTPVLLLLHYMNIIAGNFMNKKFQVPGNTLYRMKKGVFYNGKIPALLKSSFVSIRLFSAAAWK